MSAYYNENDPFAAAWLAALIAGGHVAPGDVDTRSIVDVETSDLKGYGQYHFFAGIGGWSLALRLAGIADDAPIWTGSCPCQPLSGAGLRQGHVDERHLWPAFYRLIAECSPAILFGEQVASAAGREWLAGVRADLEGLGYAVGGADLCAASVGAPHIRQRLYWLAHADRQRLQGKPLDLWVASGERDTLAVLKPDGSGATGGLADAGSGSIPEPEWGPHRGEGHGELGTLADSGLVLAERARLEGHGGHGDDGDQSGWFDQVARRSTAAPSAAGFWRAFDTIACLDGKARRVEPGSFPLAHGVPNRVGRLRGYGNAIVAPLAAEFVAASLEVIAESGR